MPDEKKKNVFLESEPLYYKLKLSYLGELQDKFFFPSSQTLAF
jgi:hypothetical protein